MKTKTIGEHAVVVGGSIGGLLAARVLSDSYDRVTVIDRDRLGPSPQARKGAPQGQHGHGLHPGGLRAIETFLPGITDEMVRGGGVLASSTALRAIIGGHALTRSDMGHPLLCCSRPYLEHHVRGRCTAVPNISIVDRCDVVGLAATSDGSSVTGARLLRRHEGSVEEEVTCDLVVDTTGRSSRGLSWLGDLGYERPDEDELHVGVVYATRQVRLPEGAMGEDHVVIVGPEPGRPTGMYLAHQESDSWIVTVFGYQGHEPSNDSGLFLDHVRAVAPRDLWPVLENARPLTDVVRYRLPSNLRRRYENLSHFPQGFLVFGDALCSFNPIYGQGMSVSALQAQALGAELAGGRLDARPFFRRAARPIADAWDLATGADLSLSEVAGARSPRVRLLNAYVDRVQQTAERDESVSRAFLRVVGMLDRPSGLMRPGVMLRIARSTRPPRTAGTLRSVARNA